MDDIQRELVKAGRKDLAQKYFERVARTRFEDTLIQTGDDIKDISKGLAKYCEEVAGWVDVLPKKFKEMKDRDKPLLLKQVDAFAKRVLAKTDMLNKDMKLLKNLIKEGLEGKWEVELK